MWSFLSYLDVFGAVAAAVVGDVAELLVRVSNPEVSTVEIEMSNPDTWISRYLNIRILGYPCSLSKPFWLA